MAKRKYKFSANIKPKRKVSPFEMGVLLAIFLLAIFLLMEAAKTLRTEENSGPVIPYEAFAEAGQLPTVQTSWKEQPLNVLYASRQEPAVILTREGVTPIPEDHVLQFQVDPGAPVVNGMSYQVRTIGSAKLIDDGKIRKWQTDPETGRLTAQITLSNLVEDGTEYQLHLTVKTKEYGELYYRTRLFGGNEENLEQLLTFAKAFSQSTFDKTQAEAVIVPYILTGETRNNQDITHVDLYNKFSALTWGAFAPKQIGDVESVLHEISDTQLSLSFRYRVETTPEAGEASLYDVEEFYCVRMRNGNIYILDYVRDMTECFRPAADRLTNGAIQLGSGEDYSSVLSSEDGSYLTFVKGRQLWLLNTKERKLQMLYGWDNQWENRYEILPVRVSEAGLVDFLVYGCIPQGQFEGYCQIQNYRYDTEANGLQLQFYLPIEESGKVLDNYMGEIAYVSEDNVCYIMLGKSLYQIHLEDGSAKQIHNNLVKGHYSVNGAGTRIVWEEGSDLSVPDTLKELDMETGEIRTISAEEGGYIVLGGFIESDLVYGTNGKEAVGTDSSGKTVIPFHKISVLDAEGEPARIYDAGEESVLSVRVYETYIELNIGKQEDGVYTKLRTEKLLSNQKVTVGLHGSIVEKTNDQRLPEAVLVGTAVADLSEYEVVTELPQYAVIELRQLELRRDKVSLDGYYAFGEGKLRSVQGSLSTAIGKVFDVAGTVTDETMQVCWNRDTRALYTNLNIDEKEAKDEHDTLATSIEVMLAREGIYQSKIADRLKKGQTAQELLEGKLGDRVVDLTGCQVSWLLYYINLGSPVLAVTGEDTGVLIVGYDTTHVVLYNGIGGKTVVTIEEADRMFEESGRVFFGCLSGK